MQPAELQVLAHMVRGAATYVEIGVLWGWSLIHVAQNNPQVRLWGIDLFEGYYGGEDPDFERKTPTQQAVQDNLIACGVADRVTLVKANSHPFPLPDMQFDCGLIDGDHGYTACSNDWLALSARCKRVAFHDTNDEAVASVLRSIRGWRLVESAGNLNIYKKR